jgi:hypothetical protein
VRKYRFLEKKGQAFNIYVFTYCLFIPTPLFQTTRAKLEDLLPKSLFIPPPKTYTSLSPPPSFSLSSSFYWISFDGAFLRALSLSLSLCVPIPSVLPRFGMEEASFSLPPLPCFWLPRKMRVFLFLFPFSPFPSPFLFILKSIGEKNFVLWFLLLLLKFQIYGNSFYTF